MLALCSCATPRDAQLPAPCLYPLLASEGRSARGGGVVHRLYGWSRAGRYNASLESALSDRPDLVATLNRAAAQHTAGGWLMLGGEIGMLVGAVAVGLSLPGPSLSDPPREPSFAVALGDMALGAVAIAVGGGLYAHGNRSWSTALAGFNAAAERDGCRPSPLP
jgi:hypothetical protein